MNNRYLITALEKSPVAVRQLIEAIPADKWDLRTEEDRFTPREAVAHLVDCEQMSQSRLRTSVERPGDEVPLFDEDQRAIDLDYAGTDVHQQLDLWDQRRAETLAYIQSIKDWSGTIVHPEQGVMRSEDVIYTLVGHDVYHIEHLTVFLRD